jgi:hypothetical protein
MDRRNRAEPHRWHTSMSRVVRSSLGCAAILLTVGAAVAGTASAGGATEVAPTGIAPGALVSDPAPTLVALVTSAPEGPFSSGQYIEVKVGPNSILSPGARIRIEECAWSPGGTEPPRRLCDGKTRQPDRLVVSHDGSVDYLDYPIYALPDSVVLGESPQRRPRCDLSHQCVLLVGRDLGKPGQHVSSLPFYVNPTPGDTGVNPGNGLPEVPYVLALPVAAFGILAGRVLVRRRRASSVRTG